MIKKIDIDPNVGFNQSSYGNIQKLGTKNSRTIYRIIDSQGADAGKLSVPMDQSDTFEKAYMDIIDSAPQIQDYATKHSSKKEIIKRRNIARTILCAGAVVGAATSLTLSRHLSAIKTILSTVTGTLIGIGVGFIGSIAATTPPGTYKFVKATRVFSKLDIKPIQDSNN